MVHCRAGARSLMTTGWTLVRPKSPHRSPVACIRDSGYQSSHPVGRGLWPVTVCAGHQAPGSEELEVASNSHSKTTPPGSGLLAQGMDKAGCTTLAQEPRSSLPQLDWVGLSEEQPTLTVSLQQLRGQPPLAVSSQRVWHSRRIKGQSGLAVPVACKEQTVLAVLAPGV